MFAESAISFAWPLFLAEISGKGSSGENAKEVKDIFDNKDVGEKEKGGGKGACRKCLGLREIIWGVPDI